jgi:ubiquitin-like protein Pup
MSQKQQQVTKQVSTSKKDAEEVETTPVKDERNESLANDVDDILDEIDEVLEENAEEFVKQYVQRGGE